MKESATQALRHEVRALHAVTGRPLLVRAAFTGRPPPGWALRTLFGRVVVTESTRGAELAPSPAPAARLRLEVTDPEVAVRLAAPVAEVALGQPVVTHLFAPVPSVLEVRLITAGGPSTGRAVVARPSAGPDVPLPEQPGEPGTYRSVPVGWTAEFHPFEIRVDLLLLRRAFIDVGRPTTRIRLIDTT
ncbi:hypothetical protein OG884_04025 [Streptosporangium sp. NBC_01755]|uniref:hypothetical protein n=1 Tax=Streptosporangium sp. NBC_01755 TaxID=2975949 RepID=UPI002DD93F32|nr:hypothetical protein [Streptosporangium sp. NBC_01755]WSD01114.1 hypothetical protein OG884_04025 [Streptosporangium sp. NBC_01755]